MVLVLAKQLLCWSSFWLRHRSVTQRTVTGTKDRLNALDGLALSLLGEHLLRCSTFLADFGRPRSGQVGRLGSKGSNCSSFSALLASQTAILSKLATARSAQQDPLAVLGSSSGLDGDEAPKSAGVRGIAARQLLNEQFRKQPMKVVQIFKERLTIARRKGDV
jgi:hypothetical protein